MAGFRFIEYSGKDAGKILKGILTGKEETVVVDNRGHHAIGFQIEEQEPDEDDDIEERVKV